MVREPHYRGTQGRSKPPFPISLIPHPGRCELVPPSPHLTNALSFPLVTSAIAIILISFLTLSSLTLKTFANPGPSFSLNIPRVPPYSLEAKKPLKIQAEGSVVYRILALRVEFQTDTLSTTTGDGRFAYDRSSPLYQSFASDERIDIDRFPHDRDYFFDHLTFARNYFHRFSGGKLDLQYEVFPLSIDSAYQLPKQMWQYNWNLNDQQTERGLAELFRDALWAADRDISLNWNNYDVVLVFHAGAGKEFDLGYRSTPHDIPSGWIVKGDLARHLNLPDGVPVRGGHIEEGIILPETESHDGVQISMAGVIIFLLGHWLGLPPLYDSDDGSPAVGRWSLMDRGFGNFRGLLPAPPDAWSRWFMNWTNLPTIIPDSSPIELSALGTGDTARPQAVRIEINPYESFVLENRLRDPDGDGKVYLYDRYQNRMVLNEDYTWEIIDDSFRIPVDAEDWDFDLPGSGILIWHFDQRALLMNGLSGFNRDPHLRGLDLEEADGAQDIGQPYEFLTPGYGTDYGIADDAWFGSNRAHRDANRGRPVEFSAQTYPSSHTNEGFLSGVRLTQFSEPGARMRFLYQRDQFILPSSIPTGDSLISGVWGMFLPSPDSLQFLVIGRRSLSLWSQDGFLLFREDIDPVWGEPLKSVPLVFTDQRTGRDRALWATRTEDRIGSLLTFGLSPITGTFAVETLYRYPDPFSSPPRVIATQKERIGSVIYFIHEEGVLSDPHITLLSLMPDGSRLFTRLLPGRLKGAFLFPPDQLWVVNSSGEAYFVSGEGTIEECPANAELTALLAPHRWRVLGGRFFQPDQFSLAFLYRPESNQNNIATLAQPHSDLKVTNQRLTFPLSEAFFADTEEPIGGILPRVVSLDADGDGRDEILTLSEDRYLVWEVSGSLCEVSQISSSHLSLHLAGIGVTLERSLKALNLGTSHVDIVPESSLRNWGVEVTGKRGEFNQPPTILRLIPAGMSLAISSDRAVGGALMVAYWDAHRWDIVTLPSPASSWRILWQGPFGDKNHSGLSVANPYSTPTPTPPLDGLLAAELCYNWPNPAQDHTYIRYTLTSPAAVTISIYDITGNLIARFPGPGNVPFTPLEVMWNLTDIARGGYFAIIEAHSGGKIDRKRVNIAVVK